MHDDLSDMLDDAPTTPPNMYGDERMRTILSCFLVLAMSVLGCSREIKSLTAEQAAELVGKSRGALYLDGLKLIDKDVAQELAKLKSLSLSGLTSINKDVLKILKSNPKIGLPKKYRDKKD